MNSLMRFFQEFLPAIDVGVTSPFLSIQAASSTELTLPDSMVAPMLKSSRRNPDAFSFHLVSQFPKSLQFVEQRAAADAQRPGRFGAVEIMLAQRL